MANLICNSLYRCVYKKAMLLHNVLCSDIDLLIIQEFLFSKPDVLLWMKIYFKQQINTSIVSFGFLQTDGIQQMTKNFVLFP